ncbi:MAG TPA: TetR/AcrR family transcriptional regulator [Alloacidobacterium sp.]|nr:TetR/AcrR family transcriptional regulator [Alloacidobacterium sp.]
MKEITTAERIADEALKLLEDEGESAVSMRRIAQTVGITPMAIYHHFPNRETLLNFVVDREFGKFLGYIQARPLRGSLQSRLLGCMDSYIDYAFDRPRIFDYVFSQPRPGARRYPDDFRARRSPTLTPIADLVAEAMKSGFLKKDDAWEIAMELWAHAHGYVALYRGGRFHLSEAEFRALVRRSLRRLLYGLKAK